MILDKKESLFLRGNKDILKSIFGKRKDDFVKTLIEEKDPIKTEAYKIIVREWENWLLIADNVSKVKKKKENEFTGI